MMVPHFSKCPLPDREKFDSMIVRNYYPLVEKFMADTEGSIKCLIECNDFHFKLFVQTFVVDRGRCESFIQLINEIIGFTNKETNAEYLSFQTIPLNFTKRALNLLLERPLISKKEWCDRGRILNLYIHLQLNMNTDCYLKNYTPTFYDQFSKHLYLYKTFSIINEKEISFIEFQDAFSQMKSPSAHTNLIYVSSLCALYSLHLHKSPGFLIENISQFKINFLASILILKGENNYFEMKSKFSSPLDELVFKAIKIIESHIKEIGMKFTTLNQLLQPEDSQETSNGKNNVFFEKFINGDYHNFDFSKDLSKWMIQIYLHLLKFEKAISYYKSLTMKNTKSLLDWQPQWLISENTPADHIFVKLIEKFKPFSSQVDFVKTEHDPIIFGNHSIISIFYDLVEIAKLLTAYRPADELNFFNDLVARFYNPFLIELEPLKLLRLASVSEFSFHIYIIHFLSEKKLPFKLFVQYLKALKRKSDYCDDFDVFRIVFDRTKSIVERLFRKRLESLVEWEDRKSLIIYHLNLLSKTKFQMNSGLKWVGLKTSISKEIENNTFLLNNFAIINENQVNFQEYQNLYKGIMHGKISADDPLAALLSPYSYHFLHYGSEELQKLRFIFICRSVIFMKQASRQDINQAIFSSPKELASKAVKILESEICEKLTKALSNCSLLKSYFKGPKIISLSKWDRNILRNYAEGTIDMENIDLGVSKRLIKVYLLLFRYDRKLNQII
jgi:hypothetical protein